MDGQVNLVDDVLGCETDENLRKNLSGQYRHWATAATESDCGPDATFCAVSPHWIGVEDSIDNADASNDNRPNSPRTENVAGSVTFFEMVINVSFLVHIPTR